MPVDVTILPSVQLQTMIYWNSMVFYLFLRKRNSHTCRYAADEHQYKCKFNTFSITSTTIYSNTIKNQMHFCTENSEYASKFHSPLKQICISFSFESTFLHRNQCLFFYYCNIGYRLLAFFKSFLHSLNNIMHFATCHMHFR